MKSLKNEKGGLLADGTSLQPPSGRPKSPSAAPETTADPIESIGSPSRLPIGHGRTSSAGNPLKRGAGPGSTSPEPAPGGQQFATPSTVVRHAKALSSGQVIEKDPEFRRERRSAAIPVSQRRLFDHKNDDPASVNVPRRQRAPQRAPYHFQASPGQGLQVTTPGLYESSKPNTSRRLGPTQILQPNANIMLSPTTSAVNLEHPGDPTRHVAPVDKSNQPVESDDPEPDTSMLRQPETRPISHDQLVVEVKGIYAGLVMVEAKSIDVDEKHLTAAQEKELSKRTPITNDQWRSLIALHKQLLHEHHDFFLASQHPSASSSLSKLAAKYSMPARMWRHGIHAFLEVLRLWLPNSLEHMLAFIYIAYSMMALLYETVPAFEDTWIECLGDLGRYRMAVEDCEPKDREVWSGVARYWYGKASDKNPTVGRLYHHLAILARPYTLEQLCLYTRSLTCVMPFESTRGSIMTLLIPILEGKIPSSSRISLMETLGINAHAILFSYLVKPIEGFHLVMKRLKEHVIDDSFGDFEQNSHRLKRVGVFFAVANNDAMLEYGASTSNGDPRSMIRRAFEIVKLKKAREAAQVEAARTKADLSGDNVMLSTIDAVTEVEVSVNPTHHWAMLTAAEIEQSATMISHASELTLSTLSIAIDKRYWATKQLTCLLPLVHVMMIFLYSTAVAEDAISHFEKSVPWAAICLYLNNLAAQPDAVTSKVFEEEFPIPDVGVGRPLWEDFVLRGLLYTVFYFPATWFSKAGIDDEERQLETASMDSMRMERVLWLGHRIASVCGSAQICAAVLISCPDAQMDHLQRRD